MDCVAVCLPCSLYNTFPHNTVSKLLHNPYSLIICIWQKSPLCIYSYTCFDDILSKYNLFTDMLPQHLVRKIELNREYRNITLARNNKAPWWWSDKIETCRSDFKCFFIVFFVKVMKVKLLVDNRSVSTALLSAGTQCNGEFCHIIAT